MLAFFWTAGFKDPQYRTVQNPTKPLQNRTAGAAKLAKPVFPYKRNLKLLNFSFGITGFVGFAAPAVRFCSGFVPVLYGFALGAGSPHVHGSGLLWGAPPEEAERKRRLPAPRKTEIEREAGRRETERAVGAEPFGGRRWPDAKTSNLFSKARPEGHCSITVAIQMVLQDLESDN